MAHKIWMSAALFGAAMLAACGQEHATPRPGEGAAAIVESPAARPAEPPAAPGPNEGLAEQTPDYGAPGGAPDMALSDKGNPPNGSGQ